MIDSKREKLHKERMVPYLATVAMMQSLLKYFESFSPSFNFDSNLGYSSNILDGTMSSTDKA